MNLDSIRKKEEVFIHGLGNRVMFMKENLKRERETEKELFGGVMAAGMKVTSEMVFKVDGEFSIEKEE